MPNYSRLILTISFICQIFLAVGLTGWFSLKRGEQAIYEVARELQDDLSDQIEARLYNLLHTAELIDRGLVSDLKSERINIKDDLSIEKYLTEYLKFFLNTPIDTIQYANEQGDYLGVGRLRDDSLVIKVRVKGDFHTYSLDSQGKRAQLLSIQPNYDPRVREWYQKALENKGETWSSVYTMFSHPSLGLTLSTPVYNNEGQLIGIIGTDLLLKDLSKFLKELEIGKTGRTLIVEQATGKIIADSFSQEFFINSEPNNAQRLQLEGDVAQALAPHFSKNLEETEREKNIVIVDNSEKLFVQISPFKDANGLNWLLISGVSEREFQGIAQKNFNSTIALCLKVLLFSSVVAALTNQFFVKLGLRLIELRTDNLTGLPNRALLIQRLNQALKQEQRLAVLLLNCDGFHKINNSLGHTGVDRLLIAVAESLKNCLEPSDLLARLEEDKFAVLSFNSDVNQAVDLAERIRKELTPPFLIDGLQIYINNRIGIAFKNTEDTDSEHLLRDAHTAMLEAQPAHGCFYQIFESTMHQKAVEILQLESELQTALVNQQFLVYYQPIVSLSTERVIGLEALVRWRHPVKGFISPVKFIPLAEDTGLILELGFWVLSQACQQITHWGYPITLSVNLSAKQIYQPDILDKIDKILASTRINPRHLKFELTESVLIDNTEVARETLAQIRGRNIRLSLDDFGTGYSSLSYLHQFSLDTIKIDRSFVNLEKLELVKTIITLAHDLGMDVVAEGVETQQQKLYLKELGCESAQGYLFYRPLDSQGIETLLNQLDFPSD